ncbi:hypothetical protein EDC04DRAFT_1289072 [Pisolithus marmoratus]|nr:hypothetical protein EDC04DRAFT_1289072 [Pisolithus marmoratus]
MSIRYGPMISSLLAVSLRRCLTETPSAGHFCLYLMTNTRGSASIGIVKPPRSRVVYEYINQCCFQPFSPRFALRAYSSSGNTEPTTMVVHVPRLLDSYEGSRTYSVHDFLHIARSIRTETTIISCNLYRIPSLSSLYHEFLLAHVDMGDAIVGGEKLMLIIERLPRNNGVRHCSRTVGLQKTQSRLCESGKTTSTGRGPDIFPCAGVHFNGANMHLICWTSFQLPTSHLHSLNTTIVTLGSVIGTPGSF